MRALITTGRSVISLALMTLTLVTLSGCGQKGPLYLPTAQTQQQEQ